MIEKKYTLKGKYIQMQLILNNNASVTWRNTLPKLFLFENSDNKTCYFKSFNGHLKTMVLFETTYND